MGRKIFVSYKYADRKVRPFRSFRGLPVQATARDYVDNLQEILSEEIYKGENDDESLEGFKDDTIKSKLRDKIFDSSVTIVLISKGMKEEFLNERDQWIPWEIAYSLREATRGLNRSRINGLLAVVLPDEDGRYDYFIEQNDCLNCNSIKWKTETLFEILQHNMFNKKTKVTNQCAHNKCGLVHMDHDHSYIHPIKWDEFVSNPTNSIDHAVSIRDRFHEYDLVRSFKG